ncbi:MAG: DUF4403 family protein [Desulfuromonadales bacterium]|nr:DUF4403 family protein [Desulfuromonadales bacterium]
MYFVRKTLLLSGLALLVLTLLLRANVNAGDTPLSAESPKDEAFRTALKNELSSLSVTIEASENDLSNNLNRMIPKEIYKGSTSTRGLTALILRNGPIVVNAADNYIYLTIPVSMSLSYGMFETPAIANKLKFRLNAKVTPDWKINAEVYFMGLSDLLADNAGIGPLSIKPRSIVEGVTLPVQRMLSGLISTKLNEKFPLKAQMTQAWNTVQKPILLDKSYNAWLRISPQEVLLYPFYAQNKRVRLSVALKSYTELVVGPEPPARKTVPLPDLKLANTTDRAFRVALTTDLYYKDILKIALPLLLNRELGSDGRSVVMKDLDLYGNGDKLMIKVDTTGDLDGIFYLTCRPAFNPQTNVFSVEDVDFDMQSRSLLLQAADWFLHGSIRDSIREKLNMDLTERLAKAREMAGKAMARVNLADNLFLSGSVTTMRLNDVMVQKDKISIQIYAEGETSIFIH